MSSWKRIVLPAVAAVVVIGAAASWELPQARASLMGAIRSTPFASPVSAQAQDQKPFIGISLVNNSAQVKSKLNLPSDTGIVIMRVAQGSPGANAGLQQKDIITAVDGKPVSTAQDVTNAVQAKKVGDTITLSVTRADGNHDITVTLGAAPEKPAANGLPFGGLGGFLGANPAQNLQSATITVKDKNGNTKTINVVAGTVSNVSTTSITVQPNGDTNTANAQTFTVTSSTRTGRVQAANIKTGDTVIVTGDENKNALSVYDVSATATNGSNTPRGPQNMPFHRFGRGQGQGGQQPQRQPSSNGGRFSF